MEDRIQEVEADLTSSQKAALQMYEKNKVKIDQVLDEISEGLVELKDHAVNIGNEIDRQNKFLGELETAVEHTTDTIQRDRLQLRKKRKSAKIAHCGMYLVCTILILVVILIILNILRGAFTWIVCCIKSPKKLYENTNGNKNTLWIDFGLAKLCSGMEILEEFSDVTPILEDTIDGICKITYAPHCTF